MRTIPTSEIAIDYARASGPGGQNVNKRDTKAVARWCIGASTTLTETEKARVRKIVANRLNTEDELVLSADDHRSQAQNRAVAILRLQEIVGRALIPKKKRRPTKPSYASKERRLEGKRLASVKKAGRKRPDSE